MFAARLSSAVSVPAAAARGSGAAEPLLDGLGDGVVEPPSSDVQAASRGAPATSAPPAPSAVSTRRRSTAGSMPPSPGSSALDSRLSTAPLAVVPQQQIAGG